MGGLKTIRVKAGHAQEFESLFAELYDRVRASEPGCECYSLMRSRTDSNCYIVEEQYSNEAAWQQHQDSAYGAEYFPKIRALLESITVEYFDVKVS